MSPLLVTVLRLVYLLLLWLMVLAVVRVIRRDVYGTTIMRRRPGMPVAGNSKRQANSVANKISDKLKTGKNVTPPRIVVTSGPLAGASLDLANGALTFGRAPNCSLVLDDEYVSSMHAKLYWQDGTVFLADIGSTNGTFLDDVQIVGEVTVYPGQSIRIGKTVIELVK